MNLYDKQFSGGPGSNFGKSIQPYSKAVSPAAPTASASPSGGMDRIGTAMLMNMLSGGGDKGPQTQTINDLASYGGGPAVMPGQMPFNTQQSQYQQAIMKALMGV
jgi:hypothetical protein